MDITFNFLQVKSLKCPPVLQEPDTGRVCIGSALQGHKGACSMLELPWAVYTA